MPNPIYIEDSLDSDLLIAMLKKAGFSVINARTARMKDKDDIEHVKYAAINNCFLLTSDEGFAVWGEQYLKEAPGRSHPGIFIAHQASKKSRQISFAEIPRAIRNLLNTLSTQDIENKIHHLDAWKY